MKEYLGRNTVVEGQQKDAVVEELHSDEDEVLINPTVVHNITNISILCQ